MQCPSPLKSANYLEGETFLRNKHEIAFFEIKCTFFGGKENTIRRIVYKNISYGKLVFTEQLFEVGESFWNKLSKK